MAYYGIESFSVGIDVRKSALTSPAGSLRWLRNAVVNQGGEIEKARKFTAYGAAPPAASRGLVTLDRAPYVITLNGATIAPSGGNVGQYSVPWVGRTLNQVLDWDVFDGKLYLVLEDTGTAIQHFYDHVPVDFPVTPPMTSARVSKYVRTHNFKMYAVGTSGSAGGHLFFSSVGNPADWAGSGSGYIQLSSQDADAGEIVGVEAYYDKLAVFARLSTQLWQMNADPAKNQHAQTLRYTGSYAPQSIRQYVGNDLFYLQADGIRSLRAREGTATAMTADVGSPIDPLIQDLLRVNGEAWMARAIGILNPRSGRFWVIFPDRVYVLSQYLSPKIAAWSQLDVPEEIVAATVVDPAILVRGLSGVVYQYTDSGSVYTDKPVEIYLPFLSFDKPAAYKQITGLDLACEGVWNAWVGMDPEHPETRDVIGTFNGPTFLRGQIPLTGRSTHFQLSFSHQVDAVPAVLSKVFAHYIEGSES